MSAISFQYPLVFEQSPACKKLSEAKTVEYVLEAYKPATGASPQPVLAGRWVAAPKIDLNHYTCKSVVDWVEVAIETLGEHQSVNVQRYLKRALMNTESQSSVHVSGPERESFYQGSFFHIRIQQPEPDELYKLLESLCCKYLHRSLTPEELTISGIEVSVDFYACGSEHLDEENHNLRRWQLQDVLTRHIRPAPVFTELDRCSPRYFKSNKGGKSADFWIRKIAPEPGKRLSRYGLSDKEYSALRLEAHTCPALDVTSYIGSHQSEGLLVRIMDKTSDQREAETGKALALPEKQRRTRIEVSMVGEDGMVGIPTAVGLATISDLYEFDFQRLRKPMFEFFLPTFDGDGRGSVPVPGSNVTESAVFSRSGVYGLDRAHRAIYVAKTQIASRCKHADKPVRLGKKGRLISYNDLNRKMDRSLKALGRRWSRAIP